MATTSASRIQELTPVTETWNRMERNSLPETSSSQQPDFLALGTEGVNDIPDRNDTNLVLQPTVPTIPSMSKRKRLLSGESTATCTPWRTKDYTCDPAGLHEEVCDCYEYLKPRPSEIRMRLDVITRVNHIITNRWPQAVVRVFGSFCTSFFLPTSDIDLVVFGQWAHLPLFSLEEDFLTADIAVEGSILVLDKTTVPIIKFIDKLTEVKVDISFNQKTGIESAEMIQMFIQQYPVLPKLVLVLKQFLTQRNLNEVFYGGISSYSLILLLVSFLQLHPRTSATDPNANLGVLLIEFFELYGRNFNYMKTGITVLNEGSYFSKDEISHNSDRSENSLLYIIDPTNPEENASRGCYGMWQVKQSFEQAFLSLHTTVISRDVPIPQRESLLSSIIKVSEEVEEYRNWVDSNWPAHPLSPQASGTPYFPVLMPPILPGPTFVYQPVMAPFGSPLAIPNGDYPNSFPPPNLPIATLPVSTLPSSQQSSSNDLTNSS